MVILADCRAPHGQKRLRSESPTPTAIPGRVLPTAGLIASLEAVRTLMAEPVSEILFEQWKLDRVRAAVSSVYSAVVEVSSKIHSSDDRRAIQTIVLNSPEYILFAKQVSEVKRSLVNSVADGDLTVGVLFIQALTVVESDLLRSYLPLQLAGWEWDIRRFGVKFGPKPDDPFILDIPFLRDRLIATMAHSRDDESVFDRNVPLLNRLGSELDRFDNATEIGGQIIGLICPSMQAIINYLERPPFDGVRLRTRIVAGLLKNCPEPIDQKLTMALKGLKGPEGMFRAALPGYTVVNFTVRGRNASETIEDSRAIIESPVKTHEFGTGIVVQFVDSAGRGHGLRRAWLETMVAYYFSIESGLWEFSDSTHTSLRPRQLSLAVSDEDRDRIRRGLLACGRLIGLGLTNQLVPGIRLSPAVMESLRGHQLNIDVDGLSRREDADFWNGLEQLRSIDWNDTSLVELAVGHDSVEIGGVASPVNHDNVEEFILRKKYDKVRTSIEQEVGILLDGVHDVVGVGILGVFSTDELAEVLTGEQELTPENMIYAFEFSRFEMPQMVAWLTEIIQGLTSHQLVQLHAFVSGSSRPPIGAGSDGKGWLHYSVVPSKNSTSLPAAATCGMRLITPIYPSLEVFREKLHLAINEGVSIENH